ncbi:MAG: response regulator transcription factor [Chloroflexi bacterium]|nr:response regulator transcription factor [Chloroflexota bacterium]
MMPIRVLLADDHSLVRAGIRALLQQIAGVEVVAEAENGREALQRIKEFVPDIALLDIAMPEVDGLSALAQVANEFPSVRVIILSMHSDQEYVLRALRAGAKGYLLKGARTSELELAVPAVARGETYLSPAASIHVFDDVARRGNGEPRPIERLTARQRQVLKLIAEGYTRKQIAQNLKISAKTVDTFRAQLMEELNIHDVAGLVRFAISEGLVSARDPKFLE